MKFSIIISTYNRAEKVKRCIESVLAQTHKEFEVIIVDDGSTDATNKVVQHFLDDPRVHFIELGNNHGCATPARNRGISEMTGDALIIWDSDDVFYPEALTTLALAHASHPAAVFICAETDWDYGGTIRNRNDRVENIEFSYVDWYCGKRPRQAEIISVLREAVGDTRFKSRNIDFMFYNEILGRTRGNIYYVNVSSGKIFIESDSLSLTTKRRKSDAVLSIERASFIAEYLKTYGWIYKKHCPSFYGAYAYGAAVGLLLKGERSYARGLALESASLQPGIRNWGFYFFSITPFSSTVLRSLFVFKGWLRNIM